jgi:hypothetical protein
MAMEHAIEIVEPIVNLPEKISIATLIPVIQNGIASFANEDLDKIVTNCVDLTTNVVNTNRVKELFNEAPQVSYLYGVNMGKAELNIYYQSFYNTNPKRIGLGIVALILVGSTIYAGKTLVSFSKEKFKKWRNEDQQ